MGRLDAFELMGKVSRKGGGVGGGREGKEEGWVQTVSDSVGVGASK